MSTLLTEHSQVQKLVTLFVEALLKIIRIFLPTLHGTVVGAKAEDPRQPRNDGSHDGE